MPPTEETYDETAEAPSTARGRSRREKLSNAVAAAAAPPLQKEYIIWDTGNESLGFGLRVYASGRKIWFMQRKVGGKSTKFKLGVFPGTTHTAAIAAAKTHIVEFNEGLNPHELKRKLAEKRALTVGRIYAEYVDARRGDSKPRSTLDREKIQALLSTGQLWRLSFESITAGDLHTEWQRLLAQSKRGSGTTQASTAFRNLRAAWNHAVAKRALVLPNPFKGFATLVPGWHTTNRRTRIVAEENQLPKWWAGVDALREKGKPFVTAAGTEKEARHSEATIADYLQMSLLVGPRSAELLPLKWDDVDLDAQLITFKETKGGKDHMVPYGPYVGTILQRRKDAAARSKRAPEFVFPSSRRNSAGVYSHIVEPKKSFTFVSTVSGVKFSGHDVRRTFASLANELAHISTVTLEKLLGHAPTTVAGKHYVQGRMKYLRPLYIQLETAILEEAGVVPAGSAKPDTLTSTAMAALAALATEEIDESQAAALLPASVEIPTGGPGIRLRKEGTVYVAFLDDPKQGRLEAEGATAKEAKALLEELL
jgi:integrase